MAYTLTDSGLAHLNHAIEILNGAPELPYPTGVHESVVQELAAVSAITGFKTQGQFYQSMRDNPVSTLFEFIWFIGVLDNTFLLTASELMTKASAVELPPDAGVIEVASRSHGNFSSEATFQQAMRDKPVSTLTRFLRYAASGSSQNLSIQNGDPDISFGITPALTYGLTAVQEGSKTRLNWTYPGNLNFYLFGDTITLYLQRSATSLLDNPAGHDPNPPGPYTDYLDDLVGVPPTNGDWTTISTWNNSHPLPTTYLDSTFSVAASYRLLMYISDTFPPLPTVIEIDWNVVKATVSNPGTTAWIDTFGGTSYNYGQAVTIEASTGNVVFAGTFNGSTNYGSGTLTSVGSLSLVLGKYSPSGSCLWSYRFGGTGATQPKAVALDSSGNIFVAGYFTGQSNLGLGPITSAGDSDIFVAKYNSAGAVQWVKQFGGVASDLLNSLTVNSSGDVLIAGNFADTINFGGSTLYSPQGLMTVFLAKLSGANGSHIWSETFAISGQTRGNGVTVGTDGNPVIVGSVQGTINFGGGNLSTGSSFGAYAAKLSGTDGSYIWGKLFGGQSNYGDKGVSVAVDSANNIMFTGSFASPSIDFGGGHVLTNSTAKDAVFLVKLAAGTGACSWAVRSTTTRGFVDPMAVAVDANDNAILTGVFPNNATFGNTTLVSYGVDSQAAFVAKFAAASGAITWGTVFGGSTASAIVTSNAIAVRGIGNILFTGLFLGTVNMGGTTVTNHSSYDAFLIALNP